MMELADIFSNSILGYGCQVMAKIFLGYFTLLLVLLFINKGTNGKLKKIFWFLFRTWKVLLFSLIGLNVFWAIDSFLLDYNISFALNRNSEMGIMTEMEELRAFPSEEVEESEWKIDEYLQGLNVYIDYDKVSEKLTFEMLDVYKKKIQKIYEGYGSPINSIGDVDEKIFDDLQEVLQEIGNEKAFGFINEFKNYNRSYQESKNLGALYQSGRAIGDALEQNCFWEWREALFLGSEAVKRTELFLSLKKQNRNRIRDERHISAKDIAFNNGKTYSNLADISCVDSENGREYYRTFLILAYVHMLVCEMRINRENVDYAIVQYYLGNIGERILKNGNLEKTFESWMLKSSKEHYENALTAFEKGKKDYHREKNICKNIRNGLDTLKAL